MGGTSLMRMCKKLESMFWKQNGSSIAAPGCQKNFSIYQNSCERSHCLQGIRFMTFLWKSCSKSGRLRSPEMFSNRGRRHKKVWSNEFAPKESGQVVRRGYL